MNQPEQELSNEAEALELVFPGSIAHNPTVERNNTLAQCTDSVALLEHALGGNFGAVAVLLAQVFFHHWTLRQLITLFRPNEGYHQGRKNLFSILDQEDRGAYLLRIMQTLQQSPAFKVNDEMFTDTFILGKEGVLRNKFNFGHKVELDRHLNYLDPTTQVTHGSFVYEIFLFAYLFPRLNLQQNKLRIFGTMYPNRPSHWSLCVLSFKKETDSYVLQFEES